VGHRDEPLPAIDGKDDDRVVAAVPDEEGIKVAEQVAQLGEAVATYDFSGAGDAGAVLVEGRRDWLGVRGWLRVWAWSPFERGGPRTPARFERRGSCRYREATVREAAGLDRRLRINRGVVNRLWFFAAIPGQMW